MAVPEPANQVEPSRNAAGRLLAIMHEIVERNALTGRLAYSPDEAAELLGISTELVHDLLRTGQLGSRKAGRRRLIAKHHLDAFLAGEPGRNNWLPGLPVSRKRQLGHAEDR